MTNEEMMIYEEYSGKPVALLVIVTLGFLIFIGGCLWLVKMIGEFIYKLIF